MPRRLRIHAPGMIHHVMGRGANGKTIFPDGADYEHFLHRLNMLVDVDRLQIYAFALMPNHFHLLVRPLLMPLPTFMSRLLTSVAVRFNLRHDSKGHVFQSRYKSIVVEEELYLLELIRYIHLNPVRACIVKDLNDLASWPYSGHSTLMGTNKRPWLSMDETITLFSQPEQSAHQTLRKFMAAGLTMQDQPEFSGEPIDFNAVGKKVPTAHNERILGSSKFVREFLERYADQCQSPLLPMTTTEKPTNLRDKLFTDVARHFKLTVSELCSGSKRPIVIKARFVAIWLGTKDLGIQANDLALALGIRRQAVHRTISKKTPELEKEAMLIGSKR